METASIQFRTMVYFVISGLTVVRRTGGGGNVEDETSFSFCLSCETNKLTEFLAVDANMAHPAPDRNTGEVSLDKTPEFL